MSATKSTNTHDRVMLKDTPRVRAIKALLAAQDPTYSEHARQLREDLVSEACHAERGFHLQDVHVHANVGEDGAVVVWCDTTEEPTPDVLRVNVNDGGVFNYPEVYTEREGVLIRALDDLRRCSGVHTTDQRTGETFANIIEAALAKAGMS